MQNCRNDDVQEYMNHYDFTVVCTVHQLFLMSFSSTVITL